jgi:hypothetical protein
VRLKEDDYVRVINREHQFYMRCGWITWVRQAPLDMELNWDCYVAFDNEHICGFWAHELELEEGPW